MAGRETGSHLLQKGRKGSGVQCFVLKPQLVLREKTWPQRNPLPTYLIRSLVEGEETERDSEKVHCLCGEKALSLLFDNDKQLQHCH